MPQKQDSIFYQSSTVTPPLKQIAEEFGDNLELLSAIGKLHLLSVLAFWQAVDTELQETTEDETYTLPEAIEDYAADLPEDALAALKSLEGLTDQACLDLIVAIANQIRDGVFQQ